MRVASQSTTASSLPPLLAGGGRQNIMKNFIVVALSILLCACADMYVTKTDVATPGGMGAAPVDAKDFDKGVHFVTNCGVGASNPGAIYVRPFCIDTAVFKGDEAQTDGEMPIRKAITPVEFAQDLKQHLERIAPTRILRDSERARVGWLVEGQFQEVDGGSPLGRFFLGNFGVGQSFLALHVRVTDVERRIVIYEFDMAGGSRFQGKLGTIRASGLGRATHFDLQNAAERIYLTLSANPYRYSERGSASLPE
jgi:Domain of unknown function (DUF4410)